jgi:IclR family KDG regulon transcriptional repressor
MTDDDKQPDAVSSVLKVFAILQALGDSKEFGITELSQKVLMSKSTVYRFLQTMKSLGYVSQEGESDKYALTLKLFELGSKALQNNELIDIANAHMRELSKLTKETVHLGALDEYSIVYIHKIDSQYSLRMHSRIGRRNPLHSTAIGKILMAWMDKNELDDILEHISFTPSTRHTITDPRQLLETLAQVRQQGFAEDNEEQEDGLRCIATPIYDRFGSVIAGLSLSFPSVRFLEQEKAAYINLLHAASGKISQQLGYHHYPFA